MKKTFVFLLSVLTGLFVQAQIYQSAVQKTSNERYELASDELKALIKSNPTNGDLYFYLGDNYYYWGVMDSAEMTFKKGIEVAPLNPLNYTGLGRVALASDNMDKAQMNFDQSCTIISTKSNKIDKVTQQVGYMKMAEALYQANNKNLDLALTYLNNAIKLNDKNPEVYVQLGDYNAVKEEYNLTSAILQYNKALEVDGKYTRSLVRKGALYVGVKNYDEGLKYFNEAIAIDPTFAPAYREKAELLFKAGRYPQAVESYSKYLELNNNCRVQYRYASFIFLTDDYKKAADELEKAISCDPNNGFALRLLGYANYELGNYEKGSEYLNKLFDLNSRTGKPTIVGKDYAYRGKILAKTGQDSLGIEMIKIAIEKDAEYKEGYGEIAMMYSKAKKHALAAEWFKKKIDNSTEKEPLDFYYLGQSYYFAKNYAASDSAFAQAAGTYPDANFWRGKCQSKLDNQEAPEGFAKPHYEMAISLLGMDPANIELNKKNLIEAYSYLGFFYFTKKDFNCSKTAWNKVLELDPANAKALTAITDKDITAGVGDCVLVQAPATTPGNE